MLTGDAYFATNYFQMLPSDQCLRRGKQDGRLRLSSDSSICESITFLRLEAVFRFRVYSPLVGDVEGVRFFRVGRRIAGNLTIV